MFRVSIQYVIKTRVKVWENEKIKWELNWSVSTLFLVVQNVHECMFLQRMGTQKKCFLLRL